MKEFPPESEFWDFCQYADRVSQERKMTLMRRVKSQQDVCSAHHFKSKRIKALQKFNTNVLGRTEKR